jgi:hypothetical protein
LRIAVMLKVMGPTEPHVGTDHCNRYQESEWTGPPNHQLHRRDDHQPGVRDQARCACCVPSVVS